MWIYINYYMTYACVAGFGIGHAGKLNHFMSVGYIIVLLYKVVACLHKVWFPTCKKQIQNMEYLLHH